MSRVFGYELKRLACNKLFLGLLAINGLYAWFIFTTETIAGVGYTAPFSVWSACAYVASVMPICILTVWLLIAFYHSKKEKQTEVLTLTTPVSPIRYAMLRSGVVAVCFCVMLAVVCIIGMVAYAVLFKYTNPLVFGPPILLVALPCLLLTLGLGSLAGRVHQGAVYALALLMLALGFAAAGGTFDFFGHAFYSQYPVTLPVGADGEPPFAPGAAFCLARAVYAALGLGLYALSMRGKMRKENKA